MEINERFEQIVKECFNGNKRAFAQTVGVSPTVIENVVGTRKGKPSYDVIEKICANANISADWLVLGRGEMLRSEDRQVSALAMQRNFSLRTDHPLPEQHIPLFDVAATAGLTELFIDTAAQRPVSYLSIPNLPAVDGAVYVCGDSMYPLLKSGDIVLYKKISDFEFGIFWGEMYLVSFDVEGEEFVCIKYLHRSEREGFVRLVSYNPHFEPQEIPVKRIRALALVKASVRYNTMG